LLFHDTLSCFDDDDDDDDDDELTLVLQNLQLSTGVLKSGKNSIRDV